MLPFNNLWNFLGFLLKWAILIKRHFMARQDILLRVMVGWLLATLVAGVVTLVYLSKSSTFGTNVSNNPVLATVGHQSIELQEVEQTLALPLYLLETQRHQLLQQGVQKLIDEKLLEAEETKKGVSLAQLLEEASQSEAIAKLANLPAPIKRIKTNDQPTALDAQEQARIRQALVVSLRRQAEVRITLPKVEVPVLDVEATGDRRLGPDHAPITIVEFSDFQCPYCRQSVTVLKALQRVYGDRIRLIYRDYLGPNHVHALRAAEAARCAGEQGKFWEYHDLLFDRQSAGNGWDFAALAKELHLQHDRFESCLQSHRFREQIAKDLQDGLKLGITSTPTFLINGRPLVGAQPLANFQALIDSLLARPLS